MAKVISDASKIAVCLLKNNINNIEIMEDNKKSCFTFFLSSKPTA